MLRAPDGELAVLFDLRFQNAVYAFSYARFSLRSVPDFQERIVG